jgi:hypothetical protein
MVTWTKSVMERDPTILQRFFCISARQAIPRCINGVDSIRVSPRLRNVSDEYEPEIWPVLMNELKSGDVFVDVGAHIGLYTCAAANRVGSTGAKPEETSPVGK